ncbi:pyruvate kinase isoform X1 [Tribolium castaneum]|uniref:Pyruvate kinase n=2 Tax=Tribolium castaneum TaxID=7070 RepID=A0A139WDM5_TRICA|nr:PREDICTED: pyruvate kinase isoform X1 [Tribolium castaneum]KYB25941.1 Pyruvate kinase-like Protein [Tribolium castaneum]|eukprot:XP_966428.1 PREDICTED: pyruvate kinase isoform X1 [Tribolium castaneum]
MSTQPKTNLLDYISSLDITAKPKYLRLTGIVCTIGPACQKVEILEKMLEAGMNVARLNFSHGTHEYHVDLIKNIRTAVDNYSKRIGRYCPLAIAIDTKGSEIRTGVLEGGISAEVVLEKGSKVTVTTDEKYAKKCTKSVIYVDYKNITKVQKPGNQIFIDDGLITLNCEKIQGSEITCSVANGGKLGSSKGVNLPGVEKDLPTVSEKDKKDLKFAVEQNVDCVFASFTRNAEEVRQIRSILGDSNIRVIAKIENTQGVKNMDEIIEAADGILIDRGDLGMEISFQKVFLAQKAIIARCNKVGKPIIIATHLLESMVDKPRPTRAESSDVANAVLDGADCVMLAGETAKGLYPVECVETMALICKEAEAAVWQKQLFNDLKSQPKVPLDIVQTTAISTVEASMNSLATAIIVVTKTGKSAQLLSKYKPKCPIIAVTRNAQVARQLHLFRAIMPLYFDGQSPTEWLKNVEVRVKAGVSYGKSLGFVKSGDTVIIVTGLHQGPGSTNTLTLMTVQ